MFKWIKDVKRLPAVERERDRLRGEVDLLVKRSQDSGVALGVAQRELAEVKVQLEDARKKLREQNEADLLLVSIQIAKRVIAGEKKDSPALSSLIAQQQCLLSAYPYQYGGGVLNQLGLGNVLGGMFPH